MTSACKTFETLFDSPKALGESLWGGAFTYEEDESKGYSMWFFDADNNPNNAVAEGLGLNSTVQQCHLRNDEKRNKDRPGPESLSTAECLPWRKNSCCSHAKTAPSVAHLRDLYGPTYRWDRCGELSPACERFFVFEACFYECEPLAGLYRKFGTQNNSVQHTAYNASNNSHNEWELHKMPIKASFWKEYYAACRHDKFCVGENDESFFGCAREIPLAPTVAPTVPTTISTSTDDSSKDTGLIAGLAVVSSLLVLALVAFAVYFCCCNNRKQRAVTEHSENQPHN